ncbi:MAG: GNAT family N-acetyltransferase [Planktomarina sp.]
MIIITRTDPRDPDATALLQQSHALMRELFTPDQNNFLEIDALCLPDVLFYTAREKGEMLGTAALALKQGYGEVKSMFVTDAARGKGVAAALLRQLEDTARDAKLPLIRLETGVGLDAAHRLYKRQGFYDCPVFGDYEENGASIFMEKPLDGTRD